LEKTFTFKDNMTWEVSKEGNVLVGEAVFRHENLKIRALDRGHIASGVDEVRREGILMVTLVVVEVDVAKRSRA
jgi:hypothetical protein